MVKGSNEMLSILGLRDGEGTGSEKATCLYCHGLLYIQLRDRDIILLNLSVSYGRELADWQNRSAARTMRRWMPYRRQEQYGLWLRIFSLWKFHVTASAEPVEHSCKINDSPLMKLDVS